MHAQRLSIDDRQLGCNGSSSGELQASFPHAALYRDGDINNNIFKFTICQRYFCISEVEIDTQKAN